MTGHSLSKGNKMRFTTDQAMPLRVRLEAAGYRATSKVMYVRYSKRRGDSVVIHHSLDIVRCYANTDASEILISTLGSPNGKVSEFQSAPNALTWFLNGYRGKSTTAL